MPTLAQIEANRSNSLKSTGPRSVEGKAASRFNALKTGITAKSMVIPGEDPDELAALAAGYHDQFRPATALERFLVDALVSADWQLRRLQRVEAQLWASPADTPLGDIYSSALETFTRLQRRIESTERSYYRALKELQRLQAAGEAPLASFFPIPEGAAADPPPELTAPSTPETPPPPETPAPLDTPGSSHTATTESSCARLPREAEAKEPAPTPHRLRTPETVPADVVLRFE